MKILPKLPYFLLSLTISLSAIGAPWLVAASQKACTEAEADKALDQADQLKDWDAVYRSFNRFSRCDDGAVAEGYSDTVGRLLAHDWKDFSALSKLVAADKRFASFVLGHIDETLPSDELQTIETNAKQKCPAGESVLCKKIHDKAHSAGAN